MSLLNPTVSIARVIQDEGECWLHCVETEVPNKVSGLVLTRWTRYVTAYNTGSYPTFNEVEFGAPPVGEVPVVTAQLFQYRLGLFCNGRWKIRVGNLLESAEVVVNFYRGSTLNNGERFAAHLVRADDAAPFEYQLVNAEFGQANPAACNLSRFDFSKKPLTRYTSGAVERLSADTIRVNGNGPPTNPLSEAVIQSIQKQDGQGGGQYFDDPDFAHLINARGSVYGHRWVHDIGPTAARQSPRHAGPGDGGTWTSQFIYTWSGGTLFLFMGAGD